MTGVGSRQRPRRDWKAKRVFACEGHDTGVSGAARRAARIAGLEMAMIASGRS